MRRSLSARQRRPQASSVETNWLSTPLSRARSAPSSSRTMLSTASPRTRVSPYGSTSARVGSRCRPNVSRAAQSSPSTTIRSRTPTAGRGPDFRPVRAVETPRRNSMTSVIAPPRLPRTNARIDQQLTFMIRKKRRVDGHALDRTMSAATRHAAHVATDATCEDARSNTPSPSRRTSGPTANGAAARAASPPASTARSTSAVTRKNGRSTGSRTPGPSPPATTRGPTSSMAPSRLRRFASGSGPDRQGQGTAQASSRHVRFRVRRQ